MHIKEQIINAAIEIINEEHSLSGITIRKIAKKAGIGVGLINYHFQTKENLINVAVRSFINSIIAQWNDVLPPPKSNSKLELLINMFQATADFMAHYPKITKVSILNDLNNPNLDDNTMTTLNGVLPVLRSYKTKDAIQAGVEIIALLQWYFLRNDILLKTQNFDFFNDKHRKKMVKNICQKRFSRYELNTGDTK